jgi:hypothetical protein
MSSYYERNKERIKEQRLKRYYDNKENEKKNNKEYRENNKEKIYKQQKEYRENNKEKIQKYKKSYFEDNKEKIQKYKKEFYKKYNQTDQGKKVNTIARWKSYGVIHNDFDELYELYMNTDKCNVCNNDLSTTIKCLDHDHETGEFRWILCIACNNHDSWKKKIMKE